MIARLLEAVAQLQAQLDRELRGVAISGIHWDQGVRPPIGWRAERVPDRYAWRAWPAPIWWIRRAWHGRWRLVEWGIDRGLLQSRDGGFYRDARPRGWCRLFGHVLEPELLYRAGVTGDRWASLTRWAALARAEWGGLVVLTHTRQGCERCTHQVEAELRPAHIVRVPMPEPELDTCALEGWLPELHTPPMPA